MSSSASLRHFLATGGFVLLAFLIAWLGRWVLDALASIVPEWSTAIERFGGWAVGMVVVVAVVLPLLRMYGVFAQRSK
jgi:hypothetical protein